MAVQNKQSLNILNWNANGIQNDIHELYQLMEEKFIHVSCISETFLKPHMKLPSHPNFITYRADRSDRPKGGVLITIGKNIKHKLLPHPQTTLIECIGVEIFLENNSKIQITSAYLPGGSNHTEITSKLKNDIQKLTSSNTSYFICGDFNARHRHWNCSKANQAGKILYDEYCNKNFLIKFPSSSTRIPFDAHASSSTIDLVLTNGLHSTQNFECTTMNSDHQVVTFKINLDNEIEKSPERLLPDYKNADWDRYRALIHFNINPNSLNLEDISSSIEIDEHIEKLTKLIQHARDKAIPLSFHYHYKLVIPDELRAKIKFKNALRKTWQRLRTPQLKNLLNQMEKEIKKSINNIRNDNWSAKLADIKPSNQSVWKTARMLKNSNKIIPPLKEDDKLCITSTEKAELIGKEFNKNHQNPLADTNPDFNIEIKNTVNEFLTDPVQNFSCEDFPDEDEVIGIIKNLKNAKAPGIDKINNNLLKKLPLRGVTYLLFIISACLKLSYFPESWKKAKVTPIHKVGKDSSLPSSYRPISLLCGISKILERVILNRINRFIEENEVIPPEQFGFRKKRSTTHQLSNLISHVKEKLKAKMSTGVIMLDVEKAFDRVWHEGLLYKMIKLKFPPHLIKMISSFLKNRSFYVEIFGEKSKIYNLIFGVPQGAVLSPTLYNIFTYDIPKCINTKIALFADDTAFFASSEKVNPIIRALKEHASLISSYMSKWKINLNKAKTQALFITNRRTKELPKAKIKIFDINIKWHSESKYLGMVLEKRMTFKRHIDYVIERANIAVKTLYPLINRKSKLHLKNKLLIYKLAIRPIMTYGCPAFLEIANSHIKKLQIIQNKALRMILNRSRYDKTSTIHEEAEVQPVADFIEKLTTKFKENQQQQED